MSDVVAQWLPRLEEFLFEHGLLAVQIFLVVGGYLNAKSWVRALSKAQFQLFSSLLSRYQRLVLPLLAALSFTVLVTALVRPYFDHSSLSDLPTWQKIVAHIFLLQDVLYLEAFSAGVWYVAIDFQLFAMAIACAWLAHAWQTRTNKGSAIRKALGLWMLLTLSSMFVWNLNPLGEIWGTYFFSAYGLGLCVGCWRYSGIKISHANLGLLIFILGAVATAYQPRIRLVVAVATAALLTWYEATGCKTIGSIKQRWIQELSNASYAIFLIHFGVSLGVSALIFNFWSENIPMNALGLIISFVLSVILGHQLHWHIETQEATSKRWLQWVAIFGATCTVVLLLG